MRVEHFLYFGLGGGFGGGDGGSSLDRLWRGTVLLLAPSMPSAEESREERPPGELRIGMLSYVVAGLRDAQMEFSEEVEYFCDDRPDRDSQEDLKFCLVTKRGRLNQV